MIKHLLPLLLALAPAALSAQAAEPQAGRDYVTVEPAQPFAPSGGKVEVAEVFAYTCIHCARFDPVLASWKKKHAETVKVVPVPMAFGGVGEVYARAYFAAEAMGVLDKTHQPMFDAIHVKQRGFRSPDDIVAFYGEQGIDTATFESTMNSFAVNAKIARTKQLVPRWGVEGTPSLIVAGKYRVIGGERGGFEGVLDTAEYLIAKERASGG
jgi:protein dithiol oxidoreductase (disulfide-forming)